MKTRLNVILTLGALLVMFGTASYAGAQSFAGDADQFRTEGRGYFWTGLFTPDLDAFNQKASLEGFPTLDGSLTVYGGGGYGASKRWHIGGFGGGGNFVAREGVKRSELSIGFGAAHIARVWPMGGMRVELGAVMGGGGASLLLSDGTPASGDDALSNRYDTIIDQGFFLVGPSIGAHIDLTDHMGFQITAGYLQTINGSWKHRNGDVHLTGLPDLNGSFVSIGFTFGGRSLHRR